MKRIITKDDIIGIEDDAFNGIMKIIDKTTNNLSDIDEFSENDHRILWSTYGLIEKIEKKTGHQFGYVSFNATQDIQSNCQFLLGQIHDIRKVCLSLSMEKNVNSYLEEYDDLILGTVRYNLTDDEITTIQDLLNKLRAKIVENEDISEDHKERILNKLEGLQKELHKSSNNFDKFWGVCVILNELTVNTVPIIKKLARVLCKAQARADNVNEISSDDNVDLLD